MSLETQLPTIDFSDLDLREGISSPKWEKVKSQVHKALVEYGCFEALFNKVPLDLRKATIASVEELFNLPLPMKQKLSNNTASDQNDIDKPYLGYDKYRPTVPLFEGLGIEDPNVAERVHHVTNILWPEGNPSFSKTITSFSEKLVELDHIIRKMILEALGVEKHLDEHMNITNFLLRIQKYRTPQNNETDVGLLSHRDKNMVAILYQNQVDGLEVQTKDGRWIKYTHSSDKFIVMIGEAFQAWSNGRLHCPRHRVMMSGKDETRYSVVLFSDPKSERIIKAPEELVDDEHPLLFKPFIFGEFLKFYFREGRSCESPLKTFCGV